MTQELNLSELQEFKEQFRLINGKLEKQRIVNEAILAESMNRNLSLLERSYRNRFSIPLIAAPVLTVVLSGLHYPWAFILLMDTIALLQLFLDWKSYKALDLKNLFSASLLEAGRRVALYKHHRAQAGRILSLPGIALMGWTALIACRYTWNLPILSLTAAAILIGVFREVAAERADKKALEEVLEKMKNLQEQER